MLLIDLLETERRFGFELMIVLPRIGQLRILVVMCRPEVVGGEHVFLLDLLDFFVVDLPSY